MISALLTTGKVLGKGPVEKSQNNVGEIVSIFAKFPFSVLAVLFVNGNSLFFTIQCSVRNVASLIVKVLAKIERTSENSGIKRPHDHATDFVLDYLRVHGKMVVRRLRSVEAS